MEDKQYLENLEEEVLQKNNVITYKWICQTLNVPTNVSKQMLFEFVEQQKLAGVLLKTTYLVAGLKQVDRVLTHEVCVVPDSKLESTKAKFSTLTSLHLYSVSKAELKDCNDLYTVDYDLTHGIEQKLCGIFCAAAVLRKETFRRIDKAESVGDTSKPKQAKEELETKPVVVKDANNKSTGENKKQATKNNGIMSMFHHMSNTASSCADNPKLECNGSETEAVVIKEEVKRKPGAGTNKNSKPIKGTDKKPVMKNGGISSMFQNMASKKPPPKPTSEEEKCSSSIALSDSSVCPEVTKKSSKECESSSNSTVTCSRKSQEKAQEIASKGQATSTPTLKTKRKATADVRDKLKKRKGSSEATNKRRKRIIQVSDSSSEDEVSGENSEMESPIPSPAFRRQVIDESSEDEDPIPPTPAPCPDEAPISGRRTRKLVPHTMLDENGYMVTQNRFEDALASDASADENEEPAVSNKAPSTDKHTEQTKRAPPPPVKSEKLEAKSKQATMMNFFKKK